MKILPPKFHHPQTAQQASEIAHGIRLEIKALKVRSLEELLVKDGFKITSNFFSYEGRVFDNHITNIERNDLILASSNRGHRVKVLSIAIFLFQPMDSRILCLECFLSFKRFLQM